MSIVNFITEQFHVIKSNEEISHDDDEPEIESYTREYKVIHDKTSKHIATLHTKGNNYFGHSDFSDLILHHADGHDVRVAGPQHTEDPTKAINKHFTKGTKAIHNVLQSHGINESIKISNEGINMTIENLITEIISNDEISTSIINDILGEKCIQRLENAKKEVLENMFHSEYEEDEYDDEEDDLDEAIRPESDSGKIKTILNKHTGIETSDMSLYRDSSPNFRRFKLGYLDKPITGDQHEKITSDLKSEFGDRFHSSKIHTTPVNTGMRHASGMGGNHYRVQLHQPNKELAESKYTTETYTHKGDLDTHPLSKTIKYAKKTNHIVSLNKTGKILTFNHPKTGHRIKAEVYHDVKDGKKQHKPWVNFHNETMSGNDPVSQFHDTFKHSFERFERMHSFEDN